MLTKTFLTAGIALAAFSFSAFGTVYNGNGNTGFGGAIGMGSMTLTDNGTNLFGTITKGPSGFNDVLVLYIDSITGGFANCSGFADNGDGLRRAISGFDGGANRSLMTFISGFSPDYAIALGPSSDNFGGLWQLSNGGANSLTFLNSVNLSPTGNNNSPTYTFSLNLSDLGLTPGAGQSFEIFGTYISNGGYRSDETLIGNDTGTQGWNPFTQTAFSTYTTTTVPEPSTLALMMLSGLTTLFAVRQRK